ncbi:MAG: Nif3-like dinuclear metal center hexameric protein [Pseudomonadales bacterium]
MSTTLKELVNSTDVLLQPQNFQDYCPNGLQVEGKSQVGKLVTGVTACQALLDQAVANNADAVLVHHGYFWRGEDAVIVGMKRRRIATLLQHDISLLAYHLPLDAHPELGNNAQLADVLGIQISSDLKARDAPIGSIGELGEALSGVAFARHIVAKLGREPLHVAGDTKKIKSIAWCTGAAQEYIQQAIDLGADAYLTGEVAEQTVHIAREAGIHFYAAGHHATERYGVQAVGKYLTQKFGLEHQFIDIDNPV